MLATSSANRSIQSPVPIEGSGVRANDLATPLRTGVVVADVTPLSMWHLRSDDELDRSSLPGELPPPPVGGLEEAEGWLAARLTLDETLLLWLNGEPHTDQPPVSPSSRPLRTVTEVTHGVAPLLVAGRAAADLLRKVCGLDLRERALPDRRVAETSVAKVHGTLVRRDWQGNRAYLLLVKRSVGRYVWDILRESSGEFAGGVRHGAQDVIEAWREGSSPA